MEGRAATLGGVLLLVMAAAAVPARASIAKVEGSFVPTASFTDKGDEQNSVTISADPEQRTLTFHDLTSAIEPRHRCEDVPVDTFRVDCRLGHGPGVLLDVFTGGGNDSLVNLMGDEPRFLIVFLETGPGADFVASGPGDQEVTPGIGDDVVEGGGSGDAFMSEPLEDGNDRFSGGAGDDVLYYSQRDTRASVDLAAGLAGASGEQDQLTGVEGAEGGSAVDHFTGDSQSNYFYGADGPDHIDDASGGADFLDGGDAKDEVNAGAGRDLVFARDRRRDVIDCGGGRDVAIADGQDRLIGCELDRPAPGLVAKGAAGTPETPGHEPPLIRRWRSR
jgi:Ca2+-binding RTX toxin-like protein